MNIILLSDQRLRLGGAEGPLTIESESPQVHFSPFHMLAGSLASCVFSVLYSWAANAGLHVHDLEVEVGWEFAEDPYRVGRMEVDLVWPSLPPERRASAERAAHLCTVHRTLEHPPEIVTRLQAA